MGVLVPPHAIVVDRCGFEHAEAHVVELGIGLNAYVPSLDDDGERLGGAAEPRMDGEVDWLARQLVAGRDALGAADVGQAYGDLGIAVEEPPLVVRALPVAQERERTVCHPRNPTPWPR